MRRPPDESQHFPGLAESGVERAVRVVAGQGKLARCSFVLVAPADYKLAIGLQRDTGRSRAGIKDAGEMSDNLTSSTKLWSRLPLAI